MPHDLNQCPDASLLQQFLDGGGLTDAALPWTGEILERHLNECPTCQQRLERLVAGQESWEGAARLLAGIEARKEAVTETPALRELMDHEQDQIPEALEGCSATAPSLAPLSLDFLQPSNQTDSLGRLGDYEVLEVVGRGGMGVVLKAYDPSLRRIVAIKVMAAHLASSPMARKRFIREARAAAAVSHDHVVAIYAVEEHHEPPFIVMQYIRGKTLHERLATTGPLSVTEVLRIGMQTAAGLAAAHAQGLVHRDIKPANILLENGVERVKITDFGLARAVDDVGMTQTGIVAGTPQFMAPEQANGEAIDLRSDLFSLGSVLYMLCTGRPPFRATTMMGLLKRICDETPPPIRDLNPEIPGWLEEIITKLLAKRPCDRFQSAQEVAELLGHWLAHVQRPLNVPCPAPLLKATDFSASTDQTETNGEPAANSSANTDIAARMSVFSGGYSRTAPFSGHVEQTFERALAVLTTAGFQLKQRTDCQMNLT
ncbi:MAG: serine/threonine protein kinase, partial [Planctomycetaceae bacterium]|nr:serine/threonine protein kinase [Planctomycetaceae bacterium]